MDTRKTVEKAQAQAYGKTGGRTRARNLSAARRKCIAQKAARARWGNKSKTERRKATAPARAASLKSRQGSKHLKRRGTGST